MKSHTRLLQSEVLLQINTIYPHIRTTRDALQHSTVDIQLMGNVQSSNTYLFQTFSALNVNELHLFPSHRIKCNSIKSSQSLLIVPFSTSLNAMRDISQYEKKKVARNLFEIIKVIHDRRLLADYWLSHGRRPRHTQLDSSCLLTLDEWNEQENKENKNSYRMSSQIVNERKSRTFLSSSTSFPTHIGARAAL